MFRKISTRTIISLSAVTGALALSACSTQSTGTRYGDIYESGGSGCDVSYEECGYVVETHQFQVPGCGPVTVPCMPPPPQMRCPVDTMLSADGSYCLKVEYRERELTCPAYTTLSSDGSYCAKTEYKTEYKEREMTCPPYTQRSYDGTYCLKVETTPPPALICPTGTIYSSDRSYCIKKK